MPVFTLARKCRGPVVLALALIAGLAGLLLARPQAALASQHQVSMLEDDPPLLTDPADTLAAFRALGANTVRVVLPWGAVAPDPSSSSVPAGFNGADPNAYPAANWAPYDQIVRDATRDGIAVDLTVSGPAPLWADGPGVPAQALQGQFGWDPNAALYGQFMRALGTRYDGGFTAPGDSAPLPAVHFWAIWNEANFGEDLGPQAVDGSRLLVAPVVYRALANAGWSALQASGHGHDTILIGEFAARGISARPNAAHPQGLPGDFGQTKPLVFIRALYCVNSRYRELRGGAAKAIGCPTNAAGSRAFRARDPGLFRASGVGDHPYAIAEAPAGGRKLDPSFAAFPQLASLEAALDKVNKVYKSHKRYPIYSDEYGYITRPPAGPPYVSPAIAAYYMNWAEYLSWKNPRVASYSQYLLEDPPPFDGQAGFASGLETYTGVQKPTYSAYRLPLYLPKTRLVDLGAAEVWGDVRPAYFETLDTGHPQQAQIQFQAGGGAFVTIEQLEVSRGYFDVHLRFRSAGNLRLAYTYPASDPFLPIGTAGTTVYSRVVSITVHRAQPPRRKRHRGKAHRGKSHHHN